MDFRTGITNDFAVLFDVSADSEGTTVGEGFAEKWGWFGVMYRLTEGKIINLERITKLELLECLTWLSYETDLNSQNKINYGSK